MRKQEVGTIEVFVGVDYETASVVMEVRAHGWQPGKGQQQQQFRAELPWFAVAQDPESVFEIALNNAKQHIKQSFLAAAELARREATFRAMNENRDKTP